jgi:glutamate-5-semialdehyde dehydrogenase
MQNSSHPFQETKDASKKLLRLSEQEINSLLIDLSKALIQKQEEILEANSKDLERMDPNDPKYDRLKLSKERLVDISKHTLAIAQMPSPLGHVFQERQMKQGPYLKQVSVPFGVIGIIYEARPNVTVDCFVLSFKSGNACILKGGSDARESNKAIVKIIHEVLEKNELPTALLHLMPHERESAKIMMEARGQVDIIIPRGGKSLIQFVIENSKVPVIETGAGICHTYLDESADLSKAPAILFNAKTRRPSVCNSLDCLLIHESQLSKLPEILAPMAEKKVTIYADEDSHKALATNQTLTAYPFLEKAKLEHFGQEFLSLKMSVKTVHSLEEALAHIELYSSKHSEAILSENPQNIARFLNEVDAAAVYSNTSTGFTDGAEFGLGAEIGISTQKLHARGPMGLKELTSTKWIIEGNGEIRN